MSTTEVEPIHDLRGLLKITPFRRLWISLGLASLGDWLSILAAAALAHELAPEGDYGLQNLAIGGVFLVRLLPALLIGPIAGAVADRLDRRWTMIVTGLVRAALLASIPLVDSLTWLFIAIFLIEVASLFWIPAKEATIPNLVPRSRLEAANQLSLVTTYGAAPVAALLFTLLTLLTGSTARIVSFFAQNPLYLAFYINALTFLVSALTIWRLNEIPKASEHVEHPSMLRTVLDGWRFIFGSPMLRGLVVGMLGAFAAGGIVIGLARTFVTDLGAGDPGFGLLFGTVFVGLATGMFVGPRLLSGFSRRRLFALSIFGAGITLSVLAVMGNIVIVVLLTFIVGALAGTAWVIGQTLIGLEVSDQLRGRTFAFVQSLIRITLILVLAAGPVIAAAIGAHHIEITEQVNATYNGAAITMLFAGLLAALVGFLSYRQMDDRSGVSLWRDLSAAVRGEPLPLPRPLPGLLIALEGGEGAGKSTQAELLAGWLREHGHEVVLTHEPGATRVGEQLRSVLLDVETGGLSPRTEALLYAADRAEHVSTVIRPALERGAVVVTDRFIDSSVAYQGSGRDLPTSQVAKLSRWAADGLKPDLTVLLDLPPDVGRHRGAAEPDRLEAEPDDFHERVRLRYLALAEQTPSRYLVVDATRPAAEVAAEVRARVRRMLPVLEAAASPADDAMTGTETELALADEVAAAGERVATVGRPDLPEAQPVETAAAAEAAVPDAVKPKGAKPRPAGPAPAKPVHRPDTAWPEADASPSAASSPAQAADSAEQPGRVVHQAPARRSGTTSRHRKPPPAQADHDREDSASLVDELLGPYPDEPQ